MKDALQKLLANIMLWFFFIIFFTLFYFIKNDLDWHGVMPQSEFVELISYKAIVIQLISAFVLFGGFALITHKATKEKDIKSGKSFMDVALAEWSSILFNFGSINLSVGLIIKDYISPLIAIACYLFGIYIFPKHNNMKGSDLEN